MNEVAYDLAVIGGGSGGFGAALAAARRGLRVVLIDAGPMLGGNSTLGGVNTWEPGVAGPGIPSELYRELSRYRQAIGVSVTTKFYTKAEPWGLSTIDPATPYRASLRRSGLPHERWARVTFEPDAMAAAMAMMLVRTGRVDLRLGCRMIAVETTARRVTGVIVESAGVQSRLLARAYIDATAQIRLCTMLGCQTYLGAEPKSMYDEPSAPEAHTDMLNGVSLCYRVAPVDVPAVEPLPDGVLRDDGMMRVHSITQYPCGDLNMNPLPLMEGMEFHRLGPEEGRRRCVVRVYQLWHTMQTLHGFDRYRMVMMFPFTGVREGPRLVGRTVLTEGMVRAGRSGQRDGDRHIALSDHALDVHGAGHLMREMKEPYGVPFDCLLPREWDNVAVACRGASFTHIAAASCRLSRTMMGLGHAAGLAAVESQSRGNDLADADTRHVQEMLAEEDVTLDPFDARFPAPGH